MKPVFQLLFLLGLLASSAGGARQTTDTTPAVIDFSLFKTGIVVTLDTPDVSGLPFVFDTGLSKHNILDARAARAMNVESSGQARYSDSSGSRGVTGVAAIDDVSIGSVDLGRQIFAVTPLPARLSQRDNGAPIAGYTGPPLMEDAVLCIDYDRQQLTRWSPRQFSGEGYQRSPMPLNHDLPTIRVTIDGVEAVLAIDTGSDSGVQLFPAFDQTHDMQSRYTDLQRGEALSGGGQRFETLAGTADEVKVGQQAIRDVPLLFIPQAFDPAWGIDGLIGYELLQRGTACLDRDREHFYWQAAG